MNTFAMLLTYPIFWVRGLVLALAPFIRNGVTRFGVGLLAGAFGVLALVSLRGPGFSPQASFITADGTTQNDWKLAGAGGPSLSTTTGNVTLDTAGANNIAIGPTHATNVDLGSTADGNNLNLDGNDIILGTTTTTFETSIRAANTVLLDSQANISVGPTQATTITVGASALTGVTDIESPPGTPGTVDLCTAAACSDVELGSGSGEPAIHIGDQTVAAANIIDVGPNNLSLVGPDSRIVVNAGTGNLLLQGLTTIRNANVVYFTVSNGVVTLGGTDVISGQLLLTPASTLACGTGTTEVVPAGSAGLIVTTGTLSSNCVLNFATNAATGYFAVDLSGATVGATFGIEFENGTATYTATTANHTSGASLAHVWTHGANTLSVSY